MLIRLTLRLSAIVGAEEIQGRSSGVAVIRPVNLLQTSTSIQRKNKPSARWEATSEFDPGRPVANVYFTAADHLRSSPDPAFAPFNAYRSLAGFSLQPGTAASAAL